MLTFLPGENAWQTEDEDADENINCIKYSQGVDQLMKIPLNNLEQNDLIKSRQCSKMKQSSKQFADEQKKFISI